MQISPLQLDMQSQSRHQNRPAVSVIARISDVLNVDGAIYPPPEMSIIVPFEDVFPPIGEVAVPQQKAQAPEFQIFPMVSGYAVGDEGQTNFVVLAMPAVAGVIRAQRKSLIDFGVSKRFVPSIIPTEPAEGPKIRGQLLFEIDAKAILHSSLLSSAYDVGSGRFSRQEQIHGFPIIPHI